MIGLGALTSRAWSLDDAPVLAGRTIMITGATSGLGLAAARALSRKKAHVIVACRDRTRGERVVAELAAPSRAQIALVNLASLASVGACVRALEAKSIVLDALINNAGVMATPAGRTEDGFETQIGTNHLGHFALTLGLIPALERSTHAGGARVVNVTSLWHRVGHVDPDDLDFERRGYDRWAAYGQSKLANLLFTLELNTRLERAGAHTRAYSAHPGYAKSELQNNAKLEGPMAFLTNVGTSFAQSTEAGALAELRAAVDPAATPGAFFGPRGPFECWGTPVLVKPARRALDASVAAALWRASETRTGARFPD